MTQLCRHCHDPARTVNRPRGLCRACFYAPGVRHLYPSTSKFAIRGIGIGEQSGKCPSAPTDALPGSPEKLAVLEHRAERGESLWHEDDQTLPRPRRRSQIVYRVARRRIA